MLLRDINPFMRCAVKFRYACARFVRCPADARILYIISGSGRLCTEEEEYSLGSGTLALIGPGMVYRLEVDIPLELIALNFDYTYDRENLEGVLAALPPENAEQVEKVEFEDSPVLSHPMILQEMFPIRPALEDILAVFQTKKCYFRQEVGSLLKLLLIRIARIGQMSNTATDDLANRIIRFIQEHFYEELTAEKIAAYFNYHVSSINRIMRRSTGTTVRSYLIRYRMEKAKTLLVSTELTVGQIAAQTGFQNAGYFSNAFRREMGCRPGAYRTAWRKNV